MTENDWLDASDVDVAVRNGEVTFSKRLAEDIAESVSGVTNVQNNLRVRGQEAVEPNAGLQAPPLGPADTTLTADVPDAPDAGTTGRASKAAGRG